MTEDTVLRVIACVERYHLETEENPNALRARIKSKTQEIKPFLYSNKGKIVLFLYQYNLFPYKIVHKVLCMRAKKRVTVHSSHLQKL